MAENKVEVVNAVNVVGFILVAMAGWIDLVGFKLFLNQRASFMTGRASVLGEKFATPGGTGEAMFIIIVVVSFIIGAGISAKITKASGLTGGLLFAGITVIVTAVLFGASSPGGEAVKAFTGAAPTLRLMTGILLPMAMGGMNAATSLTNINRTTHLTGPATDIGINLVTGNMNMVVFWMLRWIGFPLGAFLAVGVIAGMGPMIALMIPGVVIALTGIVQKMMVNIPLK